MNLSSMLNKKGQKGNKIQVDNIHINGIALFMFFVVTLIGIIGAALMDTKVSDWLIGIYMVGVMLDRVHLTFLVQSSAAMGKGGCPPLWKIPPTEGTRFILGAAVDRPDTYMDRSPCNGDSFQR